MNNHMFTSGIEIEDDIGLKLNNLQLYLTDLIDIDVMEQEIFINLLKKEEMVGKKPVNVVDIIKKYHLRRVTKSNRLHNNPFGGFSSKITVIVIIALKLLIKRYCNKNTTRKPSQTPMSKCLT